MKERGVRNQAIADTLQITMGQVCYWVRRLGAVQPRPQQPIDEITRHSVVVPKRQFQRGKQTVRRFTPREDAELLAMEAQGRSSIKMGRRLGRNPQSCRERLVTLARLDAKKERWE